LRIMNDLEYIHRLLMDKVRELLKLLEIISENKKALSSSKEELLKLYRELAVLSPPLVITRPYIDVLVRALTRINNTLFILRTEDLSIDEILLLLSEVKRLLTEYKVIAKKERFKTMIGLLTPIYTGVFIFAADALSRYLWGSDVLPVVILAFFALSTLALSLVKLKFAYYSLILGGLIGVWLDLLYPFNESGETIYSGIIYFLLLAVSLSYYNIIRTSSSEYNRRRISNLIKEATEIHEEKTMSAESTELKAKLEELMDYFTKLYGDKGKELLLYKINVMVMNGKRRDEVINELYRRLIGKAKNLSKGII